MAQAKVIGGAGYQFAGRGQEFQIFGFVLLARGFRGQPQNAMHLVIGKDRHQ